MAGRLEPAILQPCPRQAAALLLSLLILIAVAALKPQRGRIENAPAVSNVHTVAAAAGGPLVIRTPAAEFHFFPTGYLQASLLQNGQAFSLDDPPSATNISADSLLSGGKEIRDFVVDLDHARRIGEASGRLGGSGKRIEVSGKSASLPAIERTMVIESTTTFPRSP